MGRHSTRLASPDLAISTDIITAKRKRDDNIDSPELEVDLTAPEPLSKKALRKARRKSVVIEENETDTLRPKSVEAVEDDPQSHHNDPAKESSKRSDFGIWIGNLPWTATKESLRSFLEKDKELDSSSITRLHLPGPSKHAVALSQHNGKARNKGFAYVDFSDQSSLDEALALNNQFLGERRVLIKNAKDFEGRPKAAEQQTFGHPPNTRVFIGNLGFDVARDDLWKHLEQCGEIVDLFIATFEDSGKCKGYAWVDFKDLQAAESAVKGWITLHNNVEMDESTLAHDEDENPQKKPKPRKWWVNQLFGRALRIEYAEGKSVRYKKRFGVERSVSVREETHTGARINPESLDSNADPIDNKSKERKPLRKIDARNIKPGAALSAAPRASAAIVESQGTKVVFE